MLVVGDDPVDKNVLLFPLNHAVAALAHGEDEVENLRGLGGVEETHSLVDGDEGADATDASRTVSDDGLFPT